MSDHSPSAFPFPGARDNDGSPLWPGMTLRQFEYADAMVRVALDL